MLRAPVGRAYSAAAMPTTLLVLIVAAAAIVAGIVIARILAAGMRPRPDDTALSLLQNQINAAGQQSAQQAEALRKAVADSLQALNLQLSRALSETGRTLDERLNSAVKVVGDVRQQLGQLEQSSRRMIQVGEDISRLQDILRPPKLRGALGELFLADLLAQVLPTSHYELQYRFKGGETVDAVIRLRAGLVPIDAKFPLENFKRVLAAASDDERKAAKRTFVRDVKGHIDAIASKYIRMDENTFDFALMYIPAENVYYEVIIKDVEQEADLAIFGYALSRRVVPVSPNSFYAYLQTIILGLKGMRVEEQSREIIDSLSRLQKEFENFVEAFRLVGQHLDNSTKKFAEAQKRLGKLEAKVEQIDGLTRGLQAGEPPSDGQPPPMETSPVPSRDAPSSSPA